MFSRHHLGILALSAFAQYYLHVREDRNGIMLWWIPNVILGIAMDFFGVKVLESERLGQGELFKTSTL